MTLPHNLADERFQLLEQLLEDRLAEEDLTRLLIKLVEQGPEEALPALGWEFGSIDELWNSATTNERRALLRRALARRRHRGTPWAVRDALDAIGLEYARTYLRRRPAVYADGSLTANGTFYANLDGHRFYFWLVLVGDLLSEADVARVDAAVKSWKRKSTKFDGIFYVENSANFDDVSAYVSDTTVSTVVPVEFVDSAISPPTYANTITLPYTCSAGSNRKLIVLAGGEYGGGFSVVSAKYNGITLTLIRSDALSHNRLAVYYLDDEDFPNLPGTYNVEVTFSASMNAGIIGVIELAGAAQGAVLHEHVSAGSAVNISDAITPLLPGAIVLSAVVGANGGDLSASSGETIAREEASAEVSLGFGYQLDMPAEEHTVEWSSSVSEVRFLLTSLAVSPS